MARAKPTKIIDGIEHCGQREYARRRGVSNVRINELIKQGRIHAVDGHWINPAEADIALDGRISPDTAYSGIGKPGEEITLNEAKTYHELVRIKLSELDLAQKNRELAPIAVIEWTLNRIGSQIAAILETIPGKVKRRLPSLSAAEIEIIKREIVKAQNMAARVTVDLDGYRADTGTDHRD